MARRRGGSWRPGCARTSRHTPWPRSWTAGNDDYGRLRCWRRGGSVINDDNRWPFPDHDDDCVAGIFAPPHLPAADVASHNCCSRGVDHDLTIDLDNPPRDDHDPARFIYHDVTDQYYAADHHFDDHAGHHDNDGGGYDDDDGGPDDHHHDADDYYHCAGS